MSNNSSRPRNPFQRSNFNALSQQTNNLNSDDQSFSRILNQTNSGINSKHQLISSSNHGNESSIKEIDNQLNSFINNPFLKVGVDYSSNQLNNYISSNNLYKDGWIFREDIKKHFFTTEEIQYKKLKFMFFPLDFSNMDDNEMETILKPELYLPCMLILTFSILNSFIKTLNGEGFISENISSETLKFISLILFIG